MEPNSSSADSPMEARIARLESDVSHLRSDVGEIKVDLRALRDKIDDGNARLSDKMDQVDVRLSGRMDRFDAKFDSLRQEIHFVRVWGLGLYIAVAGVMLTVMGRGFGWI
jgi:septal ring factor EnvC (AmiA/AmiB activator)